MRTAEKMFSVWISRRLAGHAIALHCSPDEMAAVKKHIDSLLAPSLVDNNVREIFVEIAWRFLSVNVRDDVEGEG